MNEFAEERGDRLVDVSFREDLGLAAYYSVLSSLSLLHCRELPVRLLVRLFFLRAFAGSVFLLISVLLLIDWTYR